MSEKFETIITNVGLSLLAQVQITGIPIVFSQMAVGDSNGNYYEPNPAATALKNETWRGDITNYYPNPKNRNWLTFDSVIPANVGPFTAREVALFDNRGNMLVVGKVPASEKPDPSSGGAKDLYLKVNIQVTNTTDVTISVAPSLATASVQYVDTKIDEAMRGIKVPELSSAINSNSETMAATPKAVKTAYDLAATKAGTSVATTTAKGLMSSPDKTKLDGIDAGATKTVLNNTVTSASTTEAATAKVVKQAYDLANTKYTKPAEGIPKTDLSQPVQESLDKADNAATQEVLGELFIQAGQIMATVTDLTEDLTQHKDDHVAHNRYGVATSANAKTVTLNPAPTTLLAGFSLRFKNTTANTGAVTLNVNGLGAKPVVKNGGVALTSGKLKAGGVYGVTYDGTNFILEDEGGEYGTAGASQVLSGYTVGTENGILNGSFIPINFSIGNVPVISADTFRESTIDTTIKKVKEIKWTGPPMTLRVSFSSSAQGVAGYAQVYINGVARGVSRNPLTTATTYTEDFPVQKNDLIQLYIWNENYSSRTYCEKFRVCVNPNVGSIQLD